MNTLFHSDHWKPTKAQLERLRKMIPDEDVRKEINDRLGTTG